MAKRKLRNSDIIDLKFLSKDQFESLGEYEIAYVRPIGAKKNAGYSIHSANGTPMGYSDSKDLAILAIKENNLIPVSVH